MIDFRIYNMYITFFDSTFRQNCKLFVLFKTEQTKNALLRERFLFTCILAE